MNDSEWLVLMEVCFMSLLKLSSKNRSSCRISNHMNIRNIKNNCYVIITPGFNTLFVDCFELQEDCEYERLWLKIVIIKYTTIIESYEVI